MGWYRMTPGSGGGGGDNIDDYLLIVTPNFRSTAAYFGNIGNVINKKVLIKSSSYYPGAQGLFTYESFRNCTQDNFSITYENVNLNFNYPIFNCTNSYDLIKNNFNIYFNNCNINGIGNGGIIQSSATNYSPFNNFNITIKDSILVNVNNLGTFANINNLNSIIDNSYLKINTTSLSLNFLGSNTLYKNLNIGGNNLNFYVSVNANYENVYQNSIANPSYNIFSDFPRSSNKNVDTIIYNLKNLNFISQNENHYCNAFTDLIFKYNNYNSYINNLIIEGEKNFSLFNVFSNQYNFQNVNIDNLIIKDFESQNVVTGTSQNYNYYISKIKVNNQSIENIKQIDYIQFQQTSYDNNITKTQKFENIGYLANPLKGTVDTNNLSFFINNCNYFYTLQDGNFNGINVYATNTNYINFGWYANSQRANIFCNNCNSILINSQITMNSNIIINNAKDCVIPVQGNNVTYFIKNSYLNFGNISLAIINNYSLYLDNIKGILKPITTSTANYFNGIQIRVNNSGFGSNINNLFDFSSIYNNQYCRITIWCNNIDFLLQSELFKNKTPQQTLVNDGVYRQGNCNIYISNNYSG